MKRARAVVVSRRVQPKSAMTIAGAMAAILTATRRHWTVNVPALLAGTDTEAVHQFRVGLRRFRSALKLFKRHIEKEQRQWLDRDAKWFLSAFGPTRDLDVLVTELIPAVKGVEDHVAFKALQTAATTAPVATFRSAVRALRATRYQRFMIRLDMWLEGAPWRSADRSGATIETAAADIISRRLATLVARGDTLDRMNPA